MAIYNIRCANAQLAVAVQSLALEKNYQILSGGVATKQPVQAHGIVSLDSDKGLAVFANSAYTVDLNLVNYSGLVQVLDWINKNPISNKKAFGQSNSYDWVIYKDGSVDLGCAKASPSDVTIIKNFLAQDHGMKITLKDGKQLVVNPDGSILSKTDAVLIPANCIKVILAQL